MNILDDARRRRRLDTEDLLRAFTLLPAQARQAWGEARRLPLADLRGVRRVVVSGMGGSALGAHVIRSVYGRKLKIPLEIVNGYRLPGGVDSRTLVVASSYSGSTEETLAAAAEAKRRRAKIIGICSGGRLALLMEKLGAPAYVFDAKHNPGDRPRTALGYSLFGMLGLLHAGRILTNITPEVEGAIRALRRSVKRFGAAAPASRNPAKKIAALLEGKMPFFVAAEHLEGSAHVMANQLNETAKNFGGWFPIPEMNHHLMEGLKHAADGAAFVFFPSSLYHPRVQKRFPLSAAVAKKNGVAAARYDCREKTGLAQAAELLVFGGALTYYLAILNRENPSPNPWVDWFKKQMAG
ncbi:SIS domain-containing protein [Patescibacteria group bacterium]|nr:MAG: SIS domain-containing protein [Patescibacteria group bacterium]